MLDQGIGVALQHLRMLLLLGLECNIWAIPRTLAGHRVYGPPGGDRGAESTNARVFVGLGLTSRPGVLYL